MSPSAAPAYGHSGMTREQLEEKKKQFRMEQMARREANLAKREAARMADPYSRQQREMQAVFATGDVDLFAAKFLRPTAAQPEEEPKEPARPPVPTVAAIAQSVAVRLRMRPARCVHRGSPDACETPAQPSLSDEQRVLLALADQLAAERAAAKEREAAERIGRMQETLVTTLPPLRTPQVIEQEQARLHEMAKQSEEASLCVVQ